MPQRLALLFRLVLGGMLLVQGLADWSNPTLLASFLREHTAWQSVPLVGGLLPIELTLILALGRFAAGVFLLGGFITRGMALASWLGAALLVWLGADGLVFNALGLLLATSVLVFGGGGRTLDGVLGQMQRRSIEKERLREAEREAARQRRAEG